MADGSRQALAPYEVFKEELEQRRNEIAMLLPPTIKRETFIAAAIIAVKQVPELLDCDKRSLHKAVTAAASDGLMPDGREGVIVPQKETVRRKIDGNWQDVEIRSARWQTMAHGLRKRARQLDDIIIDAQVVHKNDRFLWVQGDEPRIEHEPAQLGTGRGAMIGCYAVFKRGSEVLHREVMDAEQVARVRAVSKQPNGIMWKQFQEEAWRKSVVRRGIKTVPCSPALRSIIERDHEDFDLSERAALPKPPSPRAMLDNMSNSRPSDPAPNEPAPPEDEPFTDPETYLENLATEMAAAGDKKSFDEVVSGHRDVAHRLTSEHQKDADRMIEAQAKRFKSKRESKTAQLPI